MSRGLMLRIVPLVLGVLLPVGAVAQLTTGAEASARSGSANVGLATRTVPPIEAMHRVARKLAVRFRPFVTSGRSPLCLTPTGLADGFGPAKKPYARSSCHGQQRVEPAIHPRYLGPRFRSPQPPAVPRLDAAPEPARSGRLVQVLNE